MLRKKKKLSKSGGENEDKKALLPSAGFFCRGSLGKSAHLALDLATLPIPG